MRTKTAAAPTEPDNDYAKIINETTRLQTTLIGNVNNFVPSVFLKKRFPFILFSYIVLYNLHNVHVLTTQTNIRIYTVSN